MQNTEFIEKLTIKLIEFLKTINLSNDMVESYSMLTVLSPEQKILFVREMLCPYKDSLKKELSNQLAKFGHNISEFDDKTISQFIRYLEAMIACAC